MDAVENFSTDGQVWKTQLVLFAQKTLLLDADTQYGLKLLGCQNLFAT